MLPHKLKIVALHTLSDAKYAIKEMQVRGAPLIGVTAAYGMYIAAREKTDLKIASDIFKEFYLSCLIDRESSKIAFISSTEGGMDIEKVASDTPNKIITTKIINPISQGPNPIIPPI